VGIRVVLYALAQWIDSVSFGARVPQPEPVFGSAYRRHESCDFFPEIGIIARGTRAILLDKLTRHFLLSPLIGALKFCSNVTFRGPILASGITRLKFSGYTVPRLSLVPPGVREKCFNGTRLLS